MKSKLWQLFCTFFKIGLFTFGGGYAMISVIEREVVTKRGWCTREDIMDMVIIAESTPGVIAVNSATFVGFKLGGILGAIIATLGVVLPSFVIISALYFALDAFLANAFVAAAFKGIRICVAVLILRAVLSLSREMEKNWFGILLAVAAFGLATFTNVNVIWLILGGAVFGLLYKLLRNKKPTVAREIDDDKGGEK